MKSEAEVAVIGALLCEPSLLSDVREVISERDFHNEGHRLVFETMCDLWQEDRPCDMLTLTSELRSQGLLKRVGGASALTAMTDEVPDVVNTVFYAEIVRAESLRRQLGELTMRAKELAESERTGAALSSELGRIHSELVEIVTKSVGTRGGWEQAPLIGKRIVDVAEKLADQGIQSVGIPTGLEEIDRCIGGMREGHFVVVGGRPKVGKTSFVLQVLDLTARAGKRVAMFSLEMSRDEVVQKLLANATSLWTVTMTSGLIGKVSRDSLREASLDLPETLWIDDAGGLSILDMRARARRLAMRGKLDMVVVDYIQLVRPASRGRNREQEVAEVTRMCKEMAKELKCVVLGVSQLSRAAELDGKRPRVSHFRESGAMEQDADSAILLHRPVTDLPECEMRLALNRHGPTSPWLKCAFSGLKGRFQVIGRATPTTAKRQQQPKEAPQRKGGEDDEREPWYNK